MKNLQHPNEKTAKNNQKNKLQHQYKEPISSHVVDDSLQWSDSATQGKQLLLLLSSLLLMFSDSWQICFSVFCWVVIWLWNLCLTQNLVPPLKSSIILLGCNKSWQRRKPRGRERKRRRWGGRGRGKGRGRERSWWRRKEEKEEKEEGRRQCRWWTKGQEGWGRWSAHLCLLFWSLRLEEESRGHGGRSGF